MSLRLDTIKRNYELEQLKYAVKAKRVNPREEPLHQLKAEQEPNLDEEEQAEEDDTAASSITHKLGQVDPLAELHKLEVMMINRNEFETWEAKKLKIFAQFKTLTDG